MDMMRCRNCQLSLSNLAQRQCPECAAPFKPSEFEFAPRNVRFCCPHCDQAYYGTSSKGHLEPEEFDCSRCGQRIEMDQMVLRPIEQPAAPSMPWLERRQRGWFRAWFATIGMALVSPGKLMEAGRDSKYGPAFRFSVITTSAIALVGFLPLLAFLFLIATTVLAETLDMDGVALALTIVAAFLLTMLLIVVVLVGLTLLWGPVAHV